MKKQSGRRRRRCDRGGSRRRLAALVAMERRGPAAAVGTAREEAVETVEAYLRRAGVCARVGGRSSAHTSALAARFAERGAVLAGRPERSARCALRAVGVAVSHRVAAAVAGRRAPGVGRRRTVVWSIGRRHGGVVSRGIRAGGGARLETRVVADGAGRRRVDLGRPLSRILLLVPAVVGGRPAEIGVGLTGGGLASGRSAVGAIARGAPCHDTQNQEHALRDASHSGTLSLG